MSSLRRFISLSISFSFLIMSYTGIILFLSPKGRVANWTNWELLGLDKTQYTHLHVTFMVLFLLGMFFHIYLNWGSLLNYLKNRAKSFSLFTKEFLFALGLNLLFIVGTLYYWAPFEQFLDFQEEVKASWEEKVDQAPYGHAELSTLEEFSQKTGRNVSVIVSQLNASKLKGVNLTKTIAQIAQENGKSPAQIFDMINAKPKMSTLSEGGGYGKVTLKNASMQHTFALEKALELIREKGFNATEDSTLKEIADALHVKPIELLELLKTSTQKESK
ncbi:DUF4405 domain-containing protein [Sulfurospirillum multivorans]|uniref:Flavinylation-associated cytochrome domain-containing protein n=2 Tax=Sulfurospirillum multivorans TaxID=66821 RepID=A0AA86DX70_SULMK|nr:DUF4405 domain-containing protein [Sulfurospirillum multivorans]AHJ11673.1 hypothetical protein SMUL_0391 [Sulfurospirillum multivorans DSM 12446]QEH05173.1 hypothetical protein SMN_0384 [Sulfurospirillum multivorans]